MQKLTAFIASSFLPQDQPKVQAILTHLDTLKPLGFVWCSAEPAESEPVSRKVQELIRTQDVFIGILTARHPVFLKQPTFLEALKFWRGTLKPQSFSTSPWVLQECGFALSAGMPVVLYVEPGVEAGGLQGDLEYISYPYPNTADALLKTNEMITRLMAKKSGILVETVVTEKLTAEPVEQPGTEKAEGPSFQSDTSNTPAAKGPTPLGQAFVNMMEANYAEDPQVGYPYFEEGLRLIQAGDDTLSEITWRTYYYSIRLDADPKAFDDLRELAAHNPLEELPNRYLGFALEKYSEFEQALTYFKAALAVASADIKWNDSVSCSRCLMKLRRYREAEHVLVAALGDGQLSGTATAGILARLYDVLKEDGRKIEAFSVAEHSLAKNPAQKTFRFGVGLDYYRSDFDALFLNHFTLIVDRDSTDSDSQHNLALAFDQCDLPVLSVEAYKLAIEGGVWLAGHNLGKLYLKAGMAFEATALANEISVRNGKTPPEVLPLLAEIEDKRKKEESSNKDLQLKAKNQKDFLASFGAAYLDKTSPDIDGDWLFPFGSVPLSRKGNVISGRKSEKALFSSLHSLLRGVGADTPPPDAMETTTIVGRITNRAAQITVSTTTDRVSLYGDGGKPQQTFFLAFSPDGLSVHVAEVEDNKLLTIETVKKKLKLSPPVR